jgi:S-adenosylmethionine-diacylglycerol 3-amino-3-carboxypropyl transferase
MPIDNPVQFAPVREDATAELALLDRLAPRNAQVLLVASGGCTALTLASLRPSLDLTLIDANRAQLDLVERKVAALRQHPPGSAGRRRLFGIDADDAQSLSGCGNFESLFRGWRALIDDLVLPAGGRQALLKGRNDRGDLLSNRYWPVAFDMFFGDALLEAMFGPEATQHAPRGSYPAYFRRVIEAGIQSADSSKNWFLHQVILGHYIEDELPPYLRQPGTARFDLVHAPMAQAPPFARFDLIQLSNLFDWMNADAIGAIARRLCAECRPGAVLLLRQLNNRAPVERVFASAFDVDQRLSDEMTLADRSLFYERVLVLVRR